MIDVERDLPHEDSADPDGVQMALRAARTLWSHGDTAESLRWLRRAAESASDEGADMRSLQLAKAAAELRAKLFPSGDPPEARSAAPAAESTAPVADVTEVSAPSDEGDDPPASIGTAAATLPSPPPDASVRASWEEEALAGGVPAPPPAVVTATQYLEHRRRESPRSLLRLPREESPEERAPDTVIPARADAFPSVPPPLPDSPLDEYVDAEPDDEEEEASALRLADSGALHEAVTEWPPADSGAVEHISTLPPPASGVPLPASVPPPLPVDDDPMRPEQPTVMIPPNEDRAEVEQVEPAAAAAAGVASGRAGASRVGLSGVELGGVEFSGAEPSGAELSGAELSGAERGRAGSSRVAPSRPAPAVMAPVVPEAGAGAEPSGSPSSRLTARVHHQAVRVSFVPDERNVGQFVVRPLREGEEAPDGERVALLVALEPGTPLV